MTEDEVKTDFGQRLTYGVVHKEPWALIIPWDGTHLYLVGQYRYPVNAFSWEFPQGHFEHSSIIETAREELREETGLRAKKLKPVGRFWLASGHHTQGCHIFLATQLTQGAQELEGSERGMRVKKVTPTQLQTMIRRGVIKDGPTIAALGFCFVKKLF